MKKMKRNINRSGEEKMKKKTGSMKKLISAMAKSMKMNEEANDEVMKACEKASKSNERENKCSM
jgi:hypothetical protein